MEKKELVIDYQPLWYEEDNPYKQEEYYFVKIEEISEFLYKELVGKNINTISQQEIQLDYFLYKNFKMNHNVRTTLKIIIEDSLVKTAILKSYDMGPLMKYGFLSVASIESDYICSSQIKQLIDSINHKFNLSIKFA